MRLHGIASWNVALHVSRSGACIQDVKDSGVEIESRPLFLFFPHNKSLRMSLSDEKPGKRTERRSIWIMFAIAECVTLSLDSAACPA